MQDWASDFAEGMARWSPVDPRGGNPAQDVTPGTTQMPDSGVAASFAHFPSSDKEELD